MKSRVKALVRAVDWLADTYEHEIGLLTATDDRHYLHARLDFNKINHVVEPRWRDSWWAVEVFRYEFAMWESPASTSVVCLARFDGNSSWCRVLALRYGRNGTTFFSPLTGYRSQSTPLLLRQLRSRPWPITVELVPAWLDVTLESPYFAEWIDVGPVEAIDFRELFVTTLVVMPLRSYWRSFYSGYPPAPSEYCERIEEELRRLDAVVRRVRSSRRTETNR